jgi:thiamine biosynthesis lipoprotein
MKRQNLFFFLLLLCLTACQTTSENNIYQTIRGEIFGTTYSVIYHGEGNLQAEIDTLFAEINGQVNTYLPNSLISQFNKSDELAIPDGASLHFETNYFRAKDIYIKTDSLFDPTVMPLVSYWGFGKEKRPVEQADGVKIKEMLTYVGFNKTWMETNKEDKVVDIYKKPDPRMQLDFSALAKGYAVDAIGKLIESKGIDNYMVEIGGETLTKGVNAVGKVWTIGINTPDANADPNSDFEAIIQLNDKAIATSGNYRNFYEVNGKRYAHTINPKTGYSEMNTLLSASVVMNNCMSADAYATGFMAMGLDKAFTLAEKERDIEALFIYDDNGEMKVKFTSGMEKYILE